MKNNCITIVPIMTGREIIVSGSAIGFFDASEGEACDTLEEVAKWASEKGY